MSPDPRMPAEGFSRPPAFNVPRIVLVMIVALIATHVFRVFLAGPLLEDWMVLNLSFIPGCYSDLDRVCALRASGADTWTPLSYALLHADATHVGLNAVWFLAFGSPVARRIGAGLFIGFVAAGAVAGAAVFFLVNPTLMAPVIGASGAVSALMGGACRFALLRPDGLRMTRGVERLPLASIGAALSNRTVLIFVVVFFATNLAFSSGLGGAFGEGAVAWEAHLGGFSFGFLFFRLFDRVHRPD